MEQYIKVSDIYKLLEENKAEYTHMIDAISQLPHVTLMKPTNYDWIRHMSVDAMAKFLAEITQDCSEAGNHGNSVYVEKEKMISYCTHMLKCPMSKSCQNYMKAHPNIRNVGLNARCTEESIRQWLNEVADEQEEVER